MLSGSSRQKWQRTLLALFFIAQYHCRMSYLNLRHRTRGVSRAELSASARASWNQLCQALTTQRVLTTALRTTKRTLENEQLTGALTAIKKHGENERLHSALTSARKRLEGVIFIEEDPTQPMDLSSLDKLKSTWHALETSSIPRLAPDALKAARQTFETAKIPRLTAEMLRMAPQPLKTIRHDRRYTLGLVTLGLTGVLLIALFALSGLAGSTTSPFKIISFTSAPQLVSSELNTIAHQVPANIDASQALKRISQLDPGEYASQNDYNTWAYSACSTASLTEVFDAYGYHYRIADVLKVESTLGEITPQLGLVENVGLANTAAKFGFQTVWGNNWTLDQVLSYANAGHPVIAGWPPFRYDGGHIVVVTGGDVDNVYLADSSLWNRHSVSRNQFMQWWAGFAAVVTPQ
jgi:hypothetical protein